MRTTNATTPPHAICFCSALVISCWITMVPPASAQSVSPLEPDGGRLVVVDSSQPAQGEPLPEAFKVYPVTAEVAYVVSNDGAAGIAGTAEKLIYDNPLGQFAIEFPAGQMVADDLTLSVKTDCPLTRYRFQVIGKANPDACGGEGVTCGPLRVDFSLWNECPNADGVDGTSSAVIEGTTGCASTEPGDGCMLLPDADALTEINFVPSVPVLLPSTVWLRVTMNRANAGVIVGAPALLGYSTDVLDTIGIPCNSSVGGFPNWPHSSFNASVYGDETCGDTFLTYQNIRASGGGITEGSLTCIAEDITLNRTCNMVQMEVAVRGRGRYDFELRRRTADGSPEGFCNDFSAFGPNAIPGSQFVFGNSEDGLNVHRKVFDPPVPLPVETLQVVFMGNNVNARWVLTQRDASVGSTDATYHVFSGNADGGSWALNNPDVIARTYGGFHVTITCDGAPPVGACCDQYFRDEAGEAVCRDVPEINCAFPSRGTSLRPSWQEGASCRVCDAGSSGGLACTDDTDCPESICVAAEPFEHPCGLSACCKPDQTCENLTLNECYVVEPLDRPKVYYLGQYCDERGQSCPLMACQSQDGDCMRAHDGRGCSDPFCCIYVCWFDAWCCEVEWDQTCERWANELCDRVTATNDECAPGNLETGQAGAVELLVDGPAEFAWGGNATDTPPDPICCNGGQRFCVGGCNDGALCDDDADCAGAATGFCNFDGNPSSGACSAGCNAQEPCGPPDLYYWWRTYCIGGSNYGAACAPRCADGINFGKGCGDSSACPFTSVCSNDYCMGGIDYGQACTTSADCRDFAVCDLNADCPGGTCDNTFCEGTEDGFCGEPVPRPGVAGVGSVWFFFTVPEGEGDTLDVAVSTCGSANPAKDSMVQAYAIGDNDSGVCADIGVCDGDGSLCSTVMQNCADETYCVPAPVSCSIAAQDCTFGSECVLDKDAACSTLSLIGCNDDAADGCGDSTQMHNSTLCLPNLRRGDTYYVLVSAKTEATRGAYRVTVSSATSCGGITPPANDSCPFAEDIFDLDGDGVIVQGFDLGSSTEDCRAPSCLGNMQNDVWYRYEATVTGQLLASTCGDSNETTPDTELIIYDGCDCGGGLSTEIVPGEELCCSATGDLFTCLFGSDCDIQVEAGNCYLMRLGDNSGSGAQGEMEITVTPGPECPAGTLTWNDPLSGTVDARYPQDCTSGASWLGIDTFTVTGPAGADPVDCWSMCEASDGGLGPNSIASVVEGAAGEYTITLTRPITPGSCTTITYVEASTGVAHTAKFSFLPGDVSGDGVAGPADILTLIDILNGSALGAWGAYSTDVDVSGATGAPDVLAVIDLLNGANCFAPWNGMSIETGDTCGTCPVAAP